MNIVCEVSQKFKFDWSMTKMNIPGGIVIQTFPGDYTIFF